MLGHSAIAAMLSLSSQVLPEMQKRPFRNTTEMN